MSRHQIDTLAWGHRGGSVPAELTAAWGGRAIVTADGLFDLPFDRTDCIGEQDDRIRLLDYMGAVYSPDTMRRDVAGRLTSRNIDTRSDAEVILFDDEVLRVVGSARSSAGYFYITAYMKD